jgi:hypothetical protein
MEFIVPDHYIWFVKGLKPLIIEINRALKEKPLPKGSPHDIFSESYLFRWLRELERIFLNIKEAINRTGKVLASSEPVKRDEVEKSVQEIRILVKRFVHLFHTLWQKPFPEGFEEGQHLFSALFEKPLNDLKEFFQNVVNIVENPEDAVKSNGSTTFELVLVLKIDKEAEAFHQWCHKMSDAFTIVTAFVRNSYSDRKRFYLDLKESLRLICRGLSIILALCCLFFD